MDAIFFKKFPDSPLRNLLKEDFQDWFVPCAFSDYERYFEDLCSSENVDETVVLDELKWFLNKNKMDDEARQVSTSQNLYSGENFDEAQRG